MSDLILNWRFGVWHFQIGRNAPHIRFRKNQFHIAHPPARWFQRY